MSDRYITVEWFGQGYVTRIIHASDAIPKAEVRRLVGQLGGHAPGRYVWRGCLVSWGDSGVDSQGETWSRCSSCWEGAWRPSKVAMPVHRR